MSTPTAVLNARQRLIKSIEHWCRTMSDNLPSGGPQIAAAVAADLFGDPIPDIKFTPPDGAHVHIGPVGNLAMWFALMCEDSYILPPNIMPSGIQIDPKLLVPLLALHPATFEFDLHHAASSTIVNGRTVCDICKLDIIEHFEALERAQVAQIESLMGDVEIMEATMDIQMQAILKQTDTIEAMEKIIEVDLAGHREKALADPETCPHPNWSSSTDEPLHCNECGKLLDEPPYGSKKN